MEKPKNLICSTLGLELGGGGNAGESGSTGWRGIKGRKKMGQL